MHSGTDEAIVAFDIADLLTHAGFQVVGPVPSSEGTQV
jgi:hypothetical protein